MNCLLTFYSFDPDATSRSTCSLKGAQMRIAVLIASLLFSPSSFAMDVWEFTLVGLNKQSKLVHFYPDAHEEEDTFVRDAQGDFVRIKINAFIDENNRIVLKQCIWDKAAALLECKGTAKRSMSVKYEGARLKIKNATDMVTAPVEAKKIQLALAKSETCTRLDAFFVCKDDCPPDLPKNLSIVYCGD